MQVLPTMRSVEALDAAQMPGFAPGVSLGRTGWHSKAEAAVNEQIRCVDADGCWHYVVADLN